MDLKKFLFRFWKRDSKRKISWIIDYIEKGDRIIDIGSGPGWVTHYLLDLGYDVIPVDIADRTIPGDARPKIYDGRWLPFETDSFDVALIFTVLHHVRDPVSLIMEAKRISKRIIIIEDTYNNRFMEIVTKMADLLMNLQFRGHPHNNRDGEGWRNLFEKLELEVTRSEEHRVGCLFIQSVYFLEKGQSLL